MKDLLVKHIKLGIGKKEIGKTGKGAVVGGVGALAYSIISSMGYMPDAFTTPDVMQFVVAGLTTGINFVRQFFTNHLSQESHVADITPEALDAKIQELSDNRNEAVSRYNSMQEEMNSLKSLIERQMGAISGLEELKASTEDAEQETAE